MNPYDAVLFDPPAPLARVHGYQLMGFDGNLSVASSVEADVLFLSRAFKGRFLLTNENRGILGRDVLNHLPILFDGPHLGWSEHTP